MQFFKITNKKMWHFTYNGVYSLCGNAKTVPYEYPKNLKGDYFEMIEVEQIPAEIEDSLCQACVREAYKQKIIRVSLK